MFAFKLGDKTKQWHWHVLNCHLAKMLPVVDLWSLSASTGETSQKQQVGIWGLQFFLIFCHVKLNPFLLHLYTPTLQLACNKSSACIQW